MTILVTNDDGVTARGINCLVEAIKDLGDIVVVAPDGQRSAQSKAITIDYPIRYWKQYESGNITIYRCSGTPCDCVKIGLDLILKCRPDLIVSGINYGSNSSVNVLYSGTMGAALEGCVEGIPSIGLSLCTENSNADYSEALKYSRKIIELVLQKGLPEGVCLNLNIPDIKKVKGIKVVRQGRGRWAEQFMEGVDPRGNKYYWLTGEFLNFEPDAIDTDEGALKAGYCSLVPCHIDLTHYSTVNTLKEWMYEFNKV